MFAIVILNDFQRLGNVSDHRCYELTLAVDLIKI